MLEQYYRINQAIGLHVFIEPNGYALFSACEITATSKELDFGKKIAELRDIEELKKALPAKSIVALNISGKGILTKQLERIDEVNQSNFSKVVPNGNIEDFYVQNFISGERSFVSMVRKTEADAWIKKLENIGFQPLMLSLGVFPVQHILPQLNSYGEEVILHGYTITKNEQSEWLSVTYNAGTSAKFPIKVENETMDERLLIPYAVAFQLILASKLNLIHAEVAALQEKYSRRLTNNKVRVYGVMILSVCFILLLANFVLFSWLNSANNQLSERASTTAQSVSDIGKITDQVQQKESLLKEMGWEDVVNKSKLVDDVASLLPPEITWTGFDIEPVDISQNRSQRTLSFLSREISITGISEKIIPVNEWLERIKTRGWVKKVELKNYTYNSELNTGAFTISIRY